jgi:alpha-L-fucosidase 2
VFLRAFVSRNGFNLNGDYKNQGFSCWKYRPFTLEANFAAAQAVHEILLQSWGGVVRIFPSLPAGWLDAAFDNLRTEGAFRVSAKRRQGNNEWVRLYSEKGGTVVLKNPFGGKLSLWKGAVPIQEQGNFIFKMNPGQWTEGKVNNVSSK